ncbi:MAG: pimeloyl-ACP methyl ester carboxylesterase [Myxococcota bacterium]
MVYLDQRGAGRSQGFAARDRTLDEIVADIERVQAHLEASHIGIVAHSFGGVPALRYAHQHPDRVSHLARVDTTADLRAAFDPQVAELSQLAAEENVEMPSDKGTGFDRLIALYAASALGNIPVMWFEHRGHFPFLEEPERFCKVLFEFFVSGR